MHANMRICKYIYIYIYIYTYICSLYVVGMHVYCVLVCVLIPWASWILTCICMFLIVFAFICVCCICELYLFYVAPVCAHVGFLYAMMSLHRVVHVTYHPCLSCALHVVCIRASDMDTYPFAFSIKDCQQRSQHPCWHLTSVYNSHL